MKVELVRRIQALSTFLCRDLRLARSLYCVVLFSFGIMLRAQAASSPAPVFRFNIQAAPEHLDPQKSPNTMAAYVINALWAPLLQYQNGALQFPRSHCSFKGESLRRVRCRLAQRWRWSDGHPVEASQFVNALTALREFKSAQLDQFANVARIRVLSARELEFDLKAPDGDFLYRLVDPALSPRRLDVDMGSGKVTSGYFTLIDIQAGRALHFRRNSFMAAPATPDMKAFIVDSDSTALNLFETGQLSFLRRLTADQVSRFKGTKSYIEIPLHRFDYIGFGPALESHADIRQNLIASLDESFGQFQKIFDATGRPGCIGLNKNISPKSLCFERLKLVPVSSTPPLELYFTLQGGDDLRRGMELFQAAWKKRGKLDVQLRSVELGVLNAMLKQKPPALFRRGVPLDRPTCLAALEIFVTNGPDNYVRYSSQGFDDLVGQMRRERRSAQYQRLCSVGQKMLIDAMRIIPLGEIHFAALSDGKFNGFKINILGQPDFSHLSPKEGPTKVR